MCARGRNYSWLSLHCILSQVCLFGSGWNMSRVLSVDSQSDRTSWAMKSSKTGGLSDSRRPRVPRSAQLQQPATQHCDGNSGRRVCGCCQTLGVRKQMRGADHVPRGPLQNPISCHSLLKNPLKVARTPTHMLTSRYWR